MARSYLFSPSDAWHKFVYENQMVDKAIVKRARCIVEARQ